MLMHFCARSENGLKTVLKWNSLKVPTLSRKKYALHFLWKFTKLKSYYATHIFRPFSDRFQTVFRPFSEHQFPRKWSENGLNVSDRFKTERKSAIYMYPTGSKAKDHELCRIFRPHDWWDVRSASGQPAAVLRVVDAIHSEDWLVQEKRDCPRVDFADLSQFPRSFSSNRPHFLGQET